MNSQPQNIYDDSKLKEILNTLKNDKKNPFPLDYWDKEKKDPREWGALFIAPDDSIYHGGYFKVKIKFPNNYPSSKPKFFFRTKIYHVNISSYSGEVCCTMPNTNRIRDYLDAVYLMFYFENPDNDYNYGTLCKTNRSEYEKNVHDWVVKYASIDTFENEKPCGFVD